jgi:VanZ family protein
LLSALIAAIYGALDEYHQYFVPNRSSEFLDWVADLIGVIIAVFLLRYYLINKYKLFSKLSIA